MKAILISDSWLNDIPFSEVFAVTIKSGDAMEAMPKEEKQFKIVVVDVSKEPADTRTQWEFDNGLDGWITGNSDNWDASSYWQEDAFERNGVFILPACNWAGDKYSWIEKKIALPDWNKIQLQFLRHSAAYSEFDKQWTDGLLKVTVKGPQGTDTVYEKVYSGQWSTETIDLTQYKGKTVILRFENHGKGTVRLGKTSSPLCDAEDAVIDDISLIQGK